MLQASFVEVDGVRLHLVSGGEGPAVLFLHGIPEFWYAWKAQLVALSKTHRVFAVDLPGINQSAPLAGPADYAVGPVAGLVAGLIRAVAPGQRVSLVGHDVGGMIAWEVAARSPELVDRLVVINAPPAAHLARTIAADPEQARASSYIDRFRTPGAEARLAAHGFAALSESVFGTARSPEVFPPADRKAYLGVWGRPGGLEGALAWYRAWDATTEPSPTVRAPTLVLWGLDDPFLRPCCLDGIEAHGRDVRVVRVPGGTHWIVREEPALVTAQLQDFLAPRALPRPFRQPVLDVLEAREAWRKHPDYSCFWSGPDNPRGLRLTPRVEPGRVWVRMRVEKEHSGIVGIAHGGVPFTILDGLMGWLIMSHLGRVGVTTTATIRFQSALRVGDEYEFEAVPEDEMAEVDDTVPLVARVFPVGRPERVCAEMRATFFLPTASQAERILGRPLGSLGDGLAFEAR